jgi:hypothetical protein
MDSWAPVLGAMNNAGDPYLAAEDAVHDPVSPIDQFTAMLIIYFGDDPS